MKQRTRKILLILFGALGAVVIVIWIGISRIINRPLYQYGMVRAGTDLRGALDPPIQPLDADRWRVEKDINLFHFSLGSGPGVLFVHGGPGIPMGTPPLGLIQLAQEYQIHFFDQRGCGRSTKPFDRFESKNFYKNILDLERTLGIAAQIADIERVRRILGLDKLLLVGHSFGGFLASLYAAEFPERVAALVLISPADLIVFPSEDPTLFDLIRERLPEPERQTYAAFLRSYLDFSTLFERNELELAKRHLEFGRYFLEASAGGQFMEASKPEPAEIGGWMVSAVYLSLGRRHDFRDAFRSIIAPVLILHGERDLQPEATGRRYAELIRDAEVNVIPDAGHFVFDEKPDLFADAVRLFLQRHRDGT